MAFSSAEIVDKIYKATLFRAPSTAESDYWAEQLDQQLYTPVTLTLTGAAHELFMQRNLPVANLFYGLFERLMDQDEMVFWGRILDQGAEVEGVIESFLLSTEFGQKYAGVNGLDAFKAIYARLWGAEIPATLLTSYQQQLADGSMTLTEILLELGSLPPVSLAVALGLVSASWNGLVPEFAAMETLAASSTGLSDLFQETVPEPVQAIEERGGWLTLNLAAEEAISLDLGADELRVGSVEKALTAGNMANVLYVDARAQADVAVSILGSGAGELYFASAQGDSVRMGGGNDQISLNSGTDVVVFEVTAAANGYDLISQFQIGADGDALDLRGFLNATGTANLATQDVASVAALPWANGDVLVVSGYSLDTAAEIAALFGPALPFAAPLGAAKAVVISADILGGAHLWFLANQTDLANITAEEISEVALLTGVNNLALVGFEAANFVA